ncbi:hypothetical protein ACSSS7_004948 [Eimeria intestinalis]
MTEQPHPRSPFEALYGELFDSLSRFDAMMQQSPFGSAHWWRPSAWFRPLSPIEGSPQQPQALGSHCPALSQPSNNRGEMTSWTGGGMMPWGVGGTQGGSSWFQQSSCIPRLDLRDAGDKLVLHADLPGLDKKDVKVEAHDGRLSIQAQRSSQNERSDSNFFMQERCSSSFYRSFTLPPGTQQDGIKASYNNGVLEVNIPKAPSAAAAGPKPINIE